MTVTNFSILDYLVFIGLLVVSSFIGVFFWFKSRKNATNEEFLTGSRQLGVFPVTMSLVASFMSTNTLLGQPAEVYQMGTQISMHVISLIVAVVVAAEVFLPLYCKIELLSVNEVSLLTLSSNITYVFSFSIWPNVSILSMHNWLEL